MFFSIFDIFYHHQSVITVTLSVPVYFYPDQAKYPFSMFFSAFSSISLIHFTHMVC